MKYRPPPVSLASVGLELCGFDRPQGDAALPSSPSAEPRTRKGKSSGPCRPAAEARESPRRGWPARGTSTATCLCTARRTLRSMSAMATLAGSAVTCRARGALHLSAVAARSSRMGLRLAHPRCERRPLLIYGRFFGSGKEPPPSNGKATALGYGRPV